MKDAIYIAKKLNEQGFTYCGKTAKAWMGRHQQRIYWGRDYVCIIDGVPNNRRAGKARALTIGMEALQAVQEVLKTT